MRWIIAHLLVSITICSVPLRAAAADATAPGTTVTATSSACGKALPADLGVGKTTRRTVASGGTDRVYLVHVPAKYESANATPVVLNFHGIWLSPKSQHSGSEFVPISDREGFILVSPDNNGESTRPAPASEIGFVRDVVAKIRADLCVDGRRTFATGFSRGAFLSTWLGCGAPDLVAAIAPVAGVDPPSAGCGPLPILEFHGRSDEIVPFVAGKTITGYDVGAAIDVLKSWARANGCSDAPQTDDISRGVQRLTYQGCKAATIQFLVAAGHIWPDQTFANLPASELIWQFFKAHPKQ